MMTLKLQTITRRDILYSLFAIFAFVLPISQYLSIRVLIIGCLFSFFVKDTRTNALRNLKKSWDIGLYLLVMIIGLIYSDDMRTGLRVLETNFSFIALPLLYSHLYQLSEEKLYRFFYSFIIGLTISSIICLGHAIIEFSAQGSWEVFFFYKFTDVINFHPTYLAYYLIFVITFALYLLNSEKPKINSAILVFAILFFFLVLILTGGQTAFMSLLLVCSFFLLKFMLEEKTQLKILTAVLVSILVISMFFISSIDHGIRESILNDSWDRFALWKSAIIANPDIFLGVGTGDYKTVLNEYYQSHGLSQFAIDSFNSHNQFIQIFFSNGILGLISLIILMGRPLYLAVKNNQPFGILVFFPFIIYGMTEVFLGRYQGVVFFALLHQFFVSQYLSAKPLFVLKGG